MTMKESQKTDKDKLDQNLEQLLLDIKDITSYLDNINNNLSEVLDSLKDYEYPHEKVYTYEINEDED